METNQTQVIIVGAGLAGLSCARQLQADGVSFLLLEASDKIGGRIKTDQFEGFLLDHGFQVLQTAYPEARRQLNFVELNLEAFTPGLILRWKGRFYPIADPADPVRSPRYCLNSLFAPIGTLRDRLRMITLLRGACRGTIEDLFRRPQCSTIDFLRSEGFSEKIIAQLFRPFLSGVYLDPALKASSLVFQFVLRMFAQADIALPSGGMGAIPRQLASKIPKACIRTNTRVRSLKKGCVALETGETLEAPAIVLATQAPETGRLLKDSVLSSSCGVSCLYYAAKKPPMKDKLIVLNGESEGPINSLCVMSNVAPTYAPSGEALISVTVLSDFKRSSSQLETKVRSQLADWYGAETLFWRHLKTYRIKHGLPRQSPSVQNPTIQRARIGPGIYVCGEYHNVPGVQWAMMSGRFAAESVRQDLIGKG
jgi:phytoene dehydrogenase-like protein